MSDTRLIAVTRDQAAACEEVGKSLLGLDPCGSLLLSLVTAWHLAPTQTTPEHSVRVETIDAAVRTLRLVQGGAA